MSDWRAEEIEAWLTPETRMVESLDGATVAMTLSMLSWLHYDTLLDAGYTHEQLLECVRVEGWALTSFEMRFTSTIALYWEEHEKQRGPLTMCY